MRYNKKAKRVTEDKRLRFIDLNKLIKGQEIPKIQYRPVKVTERYAYLEKIVEGLDESWSEGIYIYDIEKDNLFPADRGFAETHGAAVEIEVPSAYEDVLAIQKMSELYYCIKIFSISMTMLYFFRLDTYTQKSYSIASYEFYTDEYEYAGMEILCQNYFLFTLTPRHPQDDIPDYDLVFLVDVSKKTCFPIRNFPFRATGGKRCIIGEDVKYIFLEEIYLSEEEEMEFLMSDDLELLMKIPEDTDESFVYTNRLNLLPLENFIRLAKVGAYNYRYQVLDEIYEEGILRTIGESEEKIYYKKSKYEHILRSSKEFADRLMIGKDEIFEIDKKSMEMKKLMDVDSNSVLSFEGKHIYEIIETDERIIVYEPDVTSMVGSRPERIERFSYPRHKGCREYFYDIYGNRYLVIGVIYLQESGTKSHLKIIDMENQEAEKKCQDLYVIDDTVFFS